MLAIIPARGGSKGLPGKNIKKLFGKPLIAIAIENARNSKFIDRIIVSTDSPQIAAISRKYGAEVPFMRPAKLATDTAEAIDVYIYTIKELSALENKPMEKSFVVLQPTSPLRTTKDIDNAIKIFKEKKADSVISVTPAHQPVWWALYINNDMRIKRVFPQIKISNRQKYNEMYYPNGAVYVLKTSLLLAKKRYYSDKTYGYIMPSWRSIDIDTLDDFNLAEYFYLKNIKK